MGQMSSFHFISIWTNYGQSQSYPTFRIPRGLSGLKQPTIFFLLGWSGSAQDSSSRNHQCFHIYLVPSGNLTELLKMIIYSGYTHSTWWFSMVLLNYQRVLEHSEKSVWCGNFLASPSANDCYIAIESGPVEIASFPIKHDGSFHRYIIFISFSRA